MVDEHICAKALGNTIHARWCVVRYYIGTTYSIASWLILKAFDPIAKIFGTSK